MFWTLELNVSCLLYLNLYAGLGLESKSIDFQKKLTNWTNKSNIFLGSFLIFFFQGSRPHRKIPALDSTWRGMCFRPLGYSFYIMIQSYLCVWSSLGLISGKENGMYWYTSNAAVSNAIQAQQVNVNIFSYMNLCIFRVSSAHWHVNAWAHISKVQSDKLCQVSASQATRILVMSSSSTAKQTGHWGCLAMISISIRSADLVSWYKKNGMVYINSTWTWTLRITVNGQKEEVFKILLIQ